MNFLPQQKQEEITAIADSLRIMLEPQMIILFGSYAKGNYVEDDYVEDGILFSYVSDYDILVIVEDERKSSLKQKTIREQLRKHLHHQLQVQVLIHGIEHLNEALEDGQYFFTDIVKEGVLLYDTGKFQMAKPKEKTPEERAKLSKTYYDQWFPEAVEFIESSHDDFEKGRLKIAIFLLHQATERLFSTVSLVFVHYKPKTHDLIQHYMNAVVLDDRFKQVFPLNNEEEKRLFEVLVNAYIHSRYKPNYIITESDLVYLSSRVELLKLLTEDICKEKMHLL